MITIETARMNYFKDPKDKELLDRTTPLIREVFGYTDEEIEVFKAKVFYPPIAINVTLEQARLAMRPFVDHGMTIMASEYNEHYEHINSWLYFEIGLKPETPKSHYYDEPVILRDQLIDPYNPPAWNSGWIFGGDGYASTSVHSTTPTITCPYCKSTNCKKISALSKAGSVFMWGIFAMGKASKEWHCNNCNSNF